MQDMRLFTHKLPRTQIIFDPYRLVACGSAQYGNLWYTHPFASIPTTIPNFEANGPEVRLGSFLGLKDLVNEF